MNVKSIDSNAAVTKTGAPVLLRFFKAERPKRPNEPWVAKKDGMIYIPFRGGTVPEKEDEAWVCCVRFLAAPNVVVVTLEQRIVSQTQRRKAHRREMNQRRVVAA